MRISRRDLQALATVNGSASVLSATTGSGNTEIAENVVGRATRRTSGKKTSVWYEGDVQGARNREPGDRMKIRNTPSVFSLCRRRVRSVGAAGAAFWTMPLCLLLLWPTAFVGAGQEPAYQGKRLSYWVNALKQRNEKSRLQAEQALVSIGAPAVPALIAALKDPQLQDEAAAVLGKIGAAAKDAVPALADPILRGDVFLGSPCKNALKAIGEPAVPGLIEAMATSSNATELAYLMSEIGAPAVPGLIRLLEKASIPEPRVAAAMAMGYMRQAGQEGVPALTAALQDKEALVRRAAARALGDIGSATPPMMTALKAALSDPDDGVRYSAGESLLQLGVSGVEAVPLLIRRIEGRGNVRSALRALGEIGPPAKDAVATLIKTLKDRDLNVRILAAQALGKIGPAAREAVPALEELASASPGTLPGAIRGERDVRAALDAVLAEEVRIAARKALAAIQGR